MSEQDKELQERINEIEEALRPVIKNKQYLLGEINSLRHIIQDALGSIEELLCHFDLTEQELLTFDNNSEIFKEYLESLQEKVSRKGMTDEREQVL